MREYHFDYTDQRYLMRLLALSFFIFIILLLSMMFTADLIGIVPGILLAFVVPAVVFWMNIKKVKKKGSALIHADHVEFKIINPGTILFSEITLVKVGGYNGASLEIKEKKKFFLRANVNFADPASFSVCCAAVYQAVDAYATAQHLTVVKKKTAFEHKLQFTN